MVSIRYSRYEENRRVFRDEHVLTPEGKVVYLCRECGIPVPRGRLRHYCSPEHKQKWERENVPNGWGSMRARILERDGRRCVNCGVTEETLRVQALALTTEAWKLPVWNSPVADSLFKKAEKLRLEVDHILPVARHPELEYEPSNLRTLCHNCHRRLGRKPRGRKGGLRAFPRTEQRRLA